LFDWSFWIFPKTAWRFIPYRQAAHQIIELFLFWHEPPSGDEFLPSGATLVAFCLVVLMLIWVNITNWWSQLILYNCVMVYCPKFLVWHACDHIEISYMGSLG